MIYWVGLVNAKDGYEWGRNGDDYRYYVTCNEGEDVSSKLRIAIDQLNQELDLDHGAAIAVVRVA
jgi:hypothetical protein